VGSHGRWIVAALIVGCVVLALLLLMDEGPRGVAIESSSAIRAAGVAEATASARSRRQTDPSVPPREPGACVVVRVVAAEDGSPIGGATVDVPETSDETLREVTDREGTARFPRLAPHEWRFRANARGRLPQTAEVLAEDGVDTPLEIALVAATVLAVRVVAADGSPVRSAEVVATTVGSGETSSASTGSDGRAALATPWDTSVLVVARDAENGEAETFIRTPTVGGRIAEVLLRLPGLGRLEGVVRERDGTASPHAWICVAPASLRFVPGLIRRATWLDARAGRVHVQADAAGAFVVPGLTLGRRLHGFACETRSSFGRPSQMAEDIVPTEAAPTVRQDFTIEDYGSVEATVVDSDGAAVVGAFVQVEGWVSELEPVPPPATSNVVRRGHVLPGRRRASAIKGAVERGGSVLGGHAMVDVVAGGTAQCTLRLEPVAHVAGVVVDEAGRLVPGARVSIRGTADLPVRMTVSATTALDGAFSIATFEPSPFTVEVTAAGYLPSKSSLASASDDCRLVLQRAAIVAGALRSPDGEPVWCALGFGSPTNQHEVGFDSEGSFRESFDPATTRRLWIFFGYLLEKNADPQQRPHVDLVRYAPILRELHARGGEVQDLGLLPLDAPRPLRRRVADSAGRPVSGAVVTLDDGIATLPSWVPRPTTDAKGEFEFACAPASGLVPLLVRAPGFLDGHFEVAVPSADPPALTLSRGGVVWGEVVDTTGMVLPDSRLRLVDANGAAREAVADRHGVFAARLAPGRWTVSLPPVSQDVDVVEGADVRVRLVAPR
jgi:carboxypeptidase family protein